MIRAIEVETGMSVGILADLQGPKPRVGVMKEEVVVSAGDHINFCTGDPFEGDNNRVYMNYDKFPQMLRKESTSCSTMGSHVQSSKTNGKDEVLTEAEFKEDLYTLKRGLTAQYDHFTAGHDRKR